MRALVISKNLSNEHHIRNQLSTISEKDSLVFKYSFHDASEFILNCIEKHQEPLDLIIAYNTINGSQANDFRDWLKQDGGKIRTYSRKDFNLKAIPFVLIVGKNENKNTFHGYNSVIDDIGVEKLNLFNVDFIRVVKS